MTNPYNPYKTLLDHAFSITLNANDFFYRGCSDIVTVDICGDLDSIIKIIERYGNDGVSAIMSHARKEKPLDEYINNKFNEALKEIESKLPLLKEEEDN